MSKDSAAQAAVLEYLNKQNRPYSATDIFNNMHKEHSKTAITKALEQLASDKKLIEKVYGKQKIYYPDQAQQSALSETELKAMDTQIVELTETLKKVQTELKAKESQLTGLTSSLTTAQVNERITTLSKENEVFTLKLGTLKEGKAAVDPKEKELMCKKKDSAVKEWRQRKRMASDMIDGIMEGYPKPKKVLLDEIGIETDEEVGVKLP